MIMIIIKQLHTKQGLLLPIKSSNLVDNLSEIDNKDCKTCISEIDNKDCKTCIERRKY